MNIWEGSSVQPSLCCLVQSSQILWNTVLSTLIQQEVALRSPSGTSCTFVWILQWAHRQNLQQQIGAHEAFLQPTLPVSIGKSFNGKINFGDWAAAILHGCTSSQEDSSYSGFIFFYFILPFLSPLSQRRLGHRLEIWDSQCLELIICYCLNLCDENFSSVCQAILIFFLPVGETKPVQAEKHSLIAWKKGI